MTDQDDKAAQPAASGEDAAESPPPAETAQDPLAVAEAEAARWKDRCLRTAADLDNFRKRARRDVDDAYRRGGEDRFRDLLGVFDNLERAVAHAESATDVKALVDGIGMVMKMFADTLSKLGIERVPSVGKPFDPTMHEAIQQLETDEHLPGTIAAEVLPGYRQGDRLVRPAMVIVARSKPACPSGAPPGE